MLRVRSSRRASGLKPADYDHEIAIVDHEDSATTTSSSEAHLSRAPSEARLLPSVGEHSEQSSPRPEHVNNIRIQERPANELQQDEELPHPVLRPSIEIQEPTPGSFHNAPEVMRKKPHIERETAIDILYENERGGFCCGRALFSAAALGSLDPTPWTNAYHKPSPTSIHTAQVPDPSWEWVWSEWHLNHQEGMDEGGWEYSFAFSKRFSWHKAGWFNSFVRRRAWTRKRAKKREEDVSADPHMLNSDYFTVRAASERGSRGRSHSLASSQVPTRASMNGSTMEMEQVRPDIENLETLMAILRHARIDREKLEATENYLEHAVDLSQLPEEMHELMTLFIFQASRRLLLSRLMAIYDETLKALKDKDEDEEDPELNERKKALKAALKHADEEVRKLAYWSDVKQMAEGGESRGAVDDSKGWRNGWQGVDKSGPEPPNKGELPGPEGLGGT